MSRQRKNLVLSAILVVCCAAFLLLLTDPEKAPHAVGETRRDLARDRSTAKSAAPDSSVLVATEADPVTVERAKPRWVPDGRLWVMAVDPSGESIHAASIGVAAAEGRVAERAAASVNEDGWLGLDVAMLPADTGTVLVGADGYATVELHAPDRGQRHTVELTPYDNAAFFVFDTETLEPIANARLCVSQKLIRTYPPGGAVPGPDSANAIYASKSDDDGRGVVAVPAGVEAWHFEVDHPHYLVARDEPRTMGLGVGGTARIRVQTPAVGAIRFVGTEIVTQRVRAGGALPPHSMRPASLTRLAELREALIGDGKHVTGALFLPDPTSVRWGERSAIAKVALRQGGEREERMVLERLSEFEGAREIRVEAEGPVIETAFVTLLPPPEGVYPIDDLRFRVTVLGIGTKSRLRARLGDRIELPLGRYRVSPVVEGSAALEKTTFELATSDDAVFEMKWREGVHCYRVEIDGAPEVPFGQFLFYRDGNGYVADAMRDSRGGCTFWMRHLVATMDVYVRGWEEVPIRLVRSGQHNAWVAECTLTERRR